ncbi:non-ribosomal peptide synthetase [Gloeobacter morelensis]|uniref:Amino acid adenylation domain-containing protein n=1 Tax=Gloeobacter morelensis MG652769 TaxID=2781736 RepID=A0ABY3PJM7_9CYAN|nr:non-ribosomal peptide synthetase [Gloeobacter morelensis]UFP93833.1 amino acid adenylation domain-containing protein [Gloeobacter morelensis MG652769]
MSSQKLEGYALSPQQQRLWRLQQRHCTQPYRALCAVSIEGGLDRAAFSNAWRRVVERHEMVRTIFEALPGMALPLQVIRTDLAVPLCEHDWSDREPRLQEQQLGALWETLTQRPFDYTRGPLLEGHLVALGPRQHRLLLALPALCADATALHQWVQQLSDAYAEHLGAAPRLAEPPLQYADLAAWLNELLEADETAAGQDFWRQPPPESPSLQLPFERAGAGDGEYRPQSTSPALLPSALSAKLEHLALRGATSLEMVLLAGWGVLLGRLSGASDVLIGVGCDGRPYPELRQAIGPLARYLPVHCRLAEEPFASVLAQVADATHQGRRWQEYFAWQNLDQMPFWSFGFDYRTWPAAWVVADVRFALQRQSAHIDRCKVELVCVRAGEALTAQLFYDAGLLAAEAVEPLLGRWQALLADAAEQPQLPPGRLAVLGEDERRRLLVDCNSAPAAAPLAGCFPRLFEAQVERTPDATALVYEAQQLTYRELNRRANQLAHHLRSRGVGPQVRVGLQLERSLEMVIALLGVWKAGGAYVPLDPALPAPRLAWMAEDAQVQLVLATGADAQRSGDDRRIRLDAEQAAITRHSEANLDPAVELSHLAYVLYTSGSTGHPKGVAVEHGHLLNYLQGILPQLDLSPGASFALVSTFAADLGHTVLFPALCTGGCLHIVSGQRAFDADALAAYSRLHGIDCLKIVPSHLGALLSAARAADLLPRRCLVLGGETCSWELIAKLRQLAPSCRILNHYGPTETTVGVLTHLVEDRPHPDAATVPLGRPLANSQVYVLDEHRQPVPVGIPGELYIGGRSVARGYLNRPELSAEKFLPDPFDTQPGARLYRTGDRVRWLPDGQLEFLGRLDGQIKLRGFRIEPGEIEAVLAQHPAVSAAAVALREEGSAQPQLVAYIVPAADGLDLESLRPYLRERLAPYMIPSRCVALRALPLTPNGKLDRRALPAPDTAISREAAPHTPAEQVLAQIWAQLLRRERVGIYDNFFELGGDSILSIQMVARARQAGVRLTPRQVFEHQTIAGLAALADTVPTTQAEQGPIVGPLPLTPIQRWFFEQDLPGAHHWNQAVLLEVPADLNLDRLERAVQLLLLHHDALRLRFCREADGWRQACAPPGEVVPLRRENLTAVPPEQLGVAIAAVAAVAQAGLHLEQGPLLRAVHFDLGPNRPGRLLLVVHHLAVDGLSWRILLEDLETACGQLGRGEPLHLPSKTSSFRQWAEHLQAYARSGPLLSELDFWLSRPYHRVSSVPVDWTDGENTAATARSVAVALSAERTALLLQAVPRAYRTEINDVLLASLAQGLSRWTGASAVLVTLEGHGREDLFDGVDLSRTVGWFTTLFPVLLEVDRQADPGRQLLMVKQQLRALPQRGIGYGLLRYLAEAGPALQRLRTLPVAEVRFNYLGQFDQVLAGSALLARAREPVGPTRALHGRRSHLLDINGFILEGRLHLEWTYSEQVHRRSTVMGQAEAYLAALQQLIDQSQSAPAGGLSSEDFPQARLDQQDLDQFLSKIQPGKPRS